MTPKLEAKSSRLKSARRQSGFKTAREAAAFLKVPYATYAGHENGARGIKETELVRYSKAFNVSLHWLAFGDQVAEKKRIDITFIV